MLGYLNIVKKIYKYIIFKILKYYEIIILAKKIIENYFGFIDFVGRYRKKLKTINRRKLLIFEHNIISPYFYIYNIL